MTAEEAMAEAEAEGLELVRSSRSNNTSGFVGVYNRKPGQRKPYHASLRRDGGLHNLGYFATAEEAALAVARFLGAEECAAAAAAQATMTAEEALRLAEAEGLVLLRSSKSATGFTGVSKNTWYQSRPKPYQVHRWRNGKVQHLGCFATAEEAALKRARVVRALANGLEEFVQWPSRKRARPPPAPAPRRVQPRADDDARRERALVQWKSLLEAAVLDSKAPATRGGRCRSSSS